MVEWKPEHFVLTEDFRCCLFWGGCAGIARAKEVGKDGVEDCASLSPSASGEYNEEKM